MILLSCVEVILFDFEDFSSSCIASLHVFKSLHFSAVALLTQVCPFVLNVFKLLLAHFLVCNGEVFVETLLLCTQSSKLKVNELVNHVLTHLRCSGMMWDRGYALQQHQRTCGNRLCVHAASSSQ